MWGLISNTVKRIMRVDASTHVLKTIDYAHSETHGGDHYYIKDFADITVNKKDFLFRVPDDTKLPHIIWEFNAEGEFQIIVFRSPTWSAIGSKIAIINHEDNSKNKSLVKAYEDPTITDPGDQIWGAIAGSNKKAGGTIRSVDEINFRRSTDYLFRAIKIGQGTLWLDWLIDFYEHSFRG